MNNFEENKNKNNLVENKINNNKMKNYNIKKEK